MLSQTLRQDLRSFGMRRTHDLLGCSMSKAGSVKLPMYELVTHWTNLNNRLFLARVSRHSRGAGIYHASLVQTNSKEIVPNRSACSAMEIQRCIFSNGLMKTILVGHLLPGICVMHGDSLEVAQCSQVTGVVQMADSAHREDHYSRHLFITIRLN